MTYRGTRAYPKGALCSVEGCQKPVEKRGFCNPHYQRLRLERPIEAPMRPKQYRNEQHAIEFNTAKTEHGLIWTGGLRRGYGIITVGGRHKTAHRLVWELVNGPIPKGIELDHDLGCPRNCVTVEHLTPRTKSEHAKIGWKRGQFEGNGWTETAREKRTKQGKCILCNKEYIRDMKSKYCSMACSTKAGNLKRKERQLGLDPGTICPTLEFDTFSRKKVWKEEKGICGICGILADQDNWHLDHKIPHSKGGQHIRNNVQVSHPKCNLSKGNKMV